jgi:alkaline phosphatase
MNTRNFVGFCKRLFVAAILMAALAPARASEGAAKYVFLFVGDGMGIAQRNAAELYLSGMREAQGGNIEREAQLVMNSLPVQGFIRTNSLSGVTDSAAAGTALATGHKVKNGVISMNPDNGETFASVAEMARRKGMKVGIVTSCFLQDATPAAFYGHTDKRTERYNLGLQLADSGFEYFAGGDFLKPKGKDYKSRGLHEVAAAKGYAEVKSLDDHPASEKVIAIHPKASGGYMPWVIDNRGGPSLADFVDYGIKRLDGYAGFFMMVEGGKIDLACHANDAAASIHETIAFDEAVARAVEFMKTRPESTLIVVASDHETGGMTLDMSKTSGAALYQALGARRGSYAAFEGKVSPKKSTQLDGYIKMAQEFFGPSIKQTDELRKAFRLSMTPKNERTSAEPDYEKLYATYDPFTMACAKISDAAAGITWTTHYHTGKDVPVSAAGAGSELFAGEYENTGVCDRILSSMEDD